MSSGRYTPTCPNGAPIGHENENASPTASPCQFMATIFQDFKPKSLEPTLTFSLSNLIFRFSENPTGSNFKIFPGSDHSHHPPCYCPGPSHSLLSLGLLQWTLTGLPASTLGLFVYSQHGRQNKPVKTKVRSCQASAQNLPVVS